MLVLLDVYLAFICSLPLPRSSFGLAVRAALAAVGATFTSFFGDAATAEGRETVPVVNVSFHFL